MNCTSTIYSRDCAALAHSPQCTQRPGGFHCPSNRAQLLAIWTRRNTISSNWEYFLHTYLCSAPNGVGRENDQDVLNKNIGKREDGVSSTTFIRIPTVWRIVFWTSTKLRHLDLATPESKTSGISNNTKPWYFRKYRVIINEWIKEWYGRRHISTGKTVKRYTIRITNVGHLIWNTKHLYSVHLVLRARAKKICLILCSTAPLGAGRGLPSAAGGLLFLLLPISQCTVLFPYCLERREKEPLSSAQMTSSNQYSPF